MKCINIELIELDSGAVQKVCYHLRSRATINGLIKCKIKLLKTEKIDTLESKSLLELVTQMQESLQHRKMPLFML